MRATPLPLLVACWLWLLAATGCAGRHAIVAATGTNIGVEISENPQTQAPYAKLGYQRTEWAIVPTNRTGEKGPGDTEHSAKDHGEVLMELRYGGIFDTGPSSGIYQRLAIGRTAVTQPGAAFMFARDADGGINSTTAAALQSALTIPVVESDVVRKQLEIGRKHDCKAANAAVVDAAIIATGKWTTYDDFRDGIPPATASDVDAILAAIADVSCT
ncbi:hypothetical protein KF840_06680 [bacterium]|nr:hypothetical protein [bacterium]